MVERVGPLNINMLVECVFSIPPGLATIDWKRASIAAAVVRPHLGHVAGRPGVCYVLINLRSRAVVAEPDQRGVRARPVSASQEADA